MASTIAAGSRVEPGTWTSLSCLVLALLNSGCLGLSMKPPAKGDDARVVQVSDYRPSASARDHELAIGAAKVDDVAGTPIYPPGLAAYGRVPDNDKWQYTFSAAEGGHRLRGECTEQVGEVRFFGVGDIMLDLRCSCFEGDKRAATLTVVSGKGEAVLPGNARFAVKETRESEQGRRSRAVLGYRLAGAAGEGGIDTTRQARAYYPAQLVEAQRLPLTCLYAALLLHRPIK